MRLDEIDPGEYVADVLPRTAHLWAGRRDFDTYVTQTLEIAQGAYGRRHFRTLGLYDGREMVATFKRYERTLHLNGTRLRAVGIGAVYTPEEWRGRGYASTMLGMLLDRSRADGFDLAYLFSDIRPQFYTDIGFRTLPSRAYSARTDQLSKARVAVERLEESDWTAVRRCFDLCARRRVWGFARTPLVWDWIRMRARHGSEHPAGTPANLVVRRGRGIAAYVLGVRATERDAFVLDEIGYADDEAAAMVPALVRGAAGDLRRVTGWLPPDGTRELLPRGSVRQRKDAIFMAAPLSAAGRRLVDLAAVPSPADGVWATDHI
ncbi:MAG: GNAT family N-acetyltransferase [Vulcanimicrobiaceae bacterium]